ncbi:MAG: hypothetical protein US53_C0019G0012 [Candidatus Woesebacteria bacterium GW2011_GWA1_37_7]|uniref:Large ribosomal subunit protein uL29 n=2 Tax=Candidatus Woeseibacteriota TaxID=1752722 RepID=A0A0G0JKW3_9BACT|nr:MAG: hypothetical protein US53_C0019G0012 [Candidatus Woesebacteria bacterium GW2011_GWA1_37_7]OGM18400.1 MAG: 50S ribosomal protein L29 [Candidatus Woesebacteria bacterium RIFCSPHIGHO2_01_FULL_37_10]
MKKKELRELRLKKVGELEKLISEKKMSLLKIKLDMTAGKEKNFKKAKNLRLEIAQTLTVIEEMKLYTKPEEAADELVEGVDK